MRDMTGASGKTIPGSQELLQSLQKIEEAQQTPIHSITWCWDREGDTGSLDWGCRSDRGTYSAEALQNRFQKIAEGAEYPYLLYLPPAYDPRRDCPAILFLHGIGERGKDPLALADYGPFQYILQGHTLPFMVIAPVLEAQYHWVEDEQGNETDRQMRRLERFIGQMRRRYAIDPQRIMLTGLSMGGRGAYKLACALPDVFAAAAICCGRAAPREAPDRFYYQLEEIRFSCWIFHGLQDAVVNPEHALACARRLRSLDSERPLRLTLYPHIGHDCYVPAYLEPRLYGWFEEKRKG